jgi:AcrR family transcriptional regulator
MPRPRLVSDEDILSAVRKGVLQQGPAISLDLIAERLNVTAPALLKRFKTRNALLLAALKPPERPAFLDVIEKGPDVRPFELQLREVVEAFTAFLEDVFPCMSALRESDIPKEELKTMFKNSSPTRAIEALTAWFARADHRGLCEAADPGAAALLLLGATQMPVSIRHMLQHQGHKAANFHIDGYVQTLTRIVSRGLGVSSARSASTPRKKAP